jgi:hypothetical protein
LIRPKLQNVPQPLPGLTQRDELERGWHNVALRHEASPCFVREPEGNGVAERFIRTLKENLLELKTFDTIEQLRTALVEFATRYNETWLVARHGYKTPAKIRAIQMNARSVG